MQYSAIFSNICWCYPSSGELRWWLWSRKQHRDDLSDEFGLKWVYSVCELKSFVILKKRAGPSIYQLSRLVSGSLTFDLLSFPRRTSHVWIAPVVDHMQFEWLSGENSGNKKCELKWLGQIIGPQYLGIWIAIHRGSGFFEKIEFQNWNLFYPSRPKRSEVSNLRRQLWTWTKSSHSINLASSPSLGLWPLLIDRPVALWFDPHVWKFTSQPVIRCITRL
jgi:hypothetical protein